MWAAAVAYTLLFVVAVLTGNVLKDAQTVMDYHLGRRARSNPPIAIEASVAAVARVLRGRRSG